ncbi:MAG: hypothetical protein GX115_01890 [Ruminiclostridium sp.]|nr:hypothetical protein [Ruminiclostridium sp.]
MKNKYSAVINQFGLTFRQYRLLLSMQRFLVDDDIRREMDKDNIELKRLWLSEWENSVLKTIDEDAVERTLILDMTELQKEIDIEKESLQMTNLPFYLILLELSLFTPYYPLNSDRDKEYKTLKIASFKTSFNLVLEKFSKLLGIDKNMIKKFQDSYSKSVTAISGKTQNVIIGIATGAIITAITAGFAAPAIGTLFAAEGLFGAAAIASGLAALGGGAIAAGGLGMAGGIAVIVCGGAILGVGCGASIGSLLQVSPDFALAQAAKLEVVIREIIFLCQKDVRTMQVIIKEQRSAICKLEDELLELRISDQKNKKEVKNLEKSILYLKKALERYQNIYMEANQNEG